MTKFGKKRKNTSRKGEKHELKAMWIIKTMLELKYKMSLVVQRARYLPLGLTNGVRVLNKC